MRPILLAAALALAATAGCAKDKPTTESSTTETLPALTIDDVDKAVTAKEATAVDCNTDKLRQELGVVPGAVLISDEESYAASELPADKTRRLIFYCSSPG